MKMRILIVDDMKLARGRLRSCLERIEDVEIVGECAGARDAIRQIQLLCPDVVLLDIEMPEADGFHVVETIGPERMPLTIFVTAFDTFAIKAFESNGLDYVLKPFDQERLEKAIDRARRNMSAANDDRTVGMLKNLLHQVKPAKKHLQRLMVKKGEVVILIHTEEVDWIKASGPYVEVHVGRKMYLVRDTLNEMERKLDDQKFCRIHRSTIVNVERIRELRPLFNKDHIVKLTDGTELTLSRTYYDRFVAIV